MRRTARIARAATVAATLAVVATSLTACGGSGSGGGGKTIGVAVADQKSLFYVAEVAGIKAEAKKRGYKVKLVSANNDSNLQIKQVNDLITQQVGSLIFTSQDSTAAAAGVKAANDADIPVIAVDQRPENGQGKLATYIATDSVKAANDLATWMFEQIGGSGEIALLRGVLGSTAEIQRSKGFKEALAKNPGVKVVATETANWDETEAYKATQNMLTANPDIKAVFAESDAMSLGAAKAAKAANKQIVSVGIDGFPTMFDGISQGLTQATEAQQPYKMGKIAVDNAISLMEGKGSVPKLQYQDTVLINKDTVGQHKATEFYGPNADSFK